MFPDLCILFDVFFWKNQTVFVIKAPHATTLEVPDPDEVYIRDALNILERYLHGYYMILEPRLIPETSMDHSLVIQSMNLRCAILEREGGKTEN